MKVGEVYVGRSTGMEKTILFIGNENVFLRLSNGDEVTYTLKGFEDDHTLKKPEPKLKKLAAFVNNGGFIIDYDDDVYINREMREIVIKDGQLFIECGN